jgi:ribosome-binding factor A
MGSQRQQRVAKQILQEISMIVEQQLNDPRVQLVTFTDVHVTPDLRNARVFYSHMGDDAERAHCAEALEHASGMLRRELGRRLPLRFVPKLRFEYDDSSIRAERIATLLRKSGIVGDDE